MCGIVGIAGNTEQKHAKMFRDMLVFDTIRGWDSTGIAFVGNIDKSPEVEKEVGAPSNLWDWNTSKLLNFRGIPKLSKRVYLGHNRAATVGKVTVDNAHPFQYGDITGVHNGSLRVWSNLDDAATLDVDSKAVFNTINNKGIEYLWKNLNGAAALVWWDESDETLNMIRNKERPLYLATGENKDVIFWASEAWMIEVAAKRNDVKLGNMKNSEGKDLDQIFMLKEDFHAKFAPKATSCAMLSGKILEKKSVPTTTTGRTFSQVGDKKWGPDQAKVTKVGFDTKVSYRVKPRRHKYSQGWAVGLDKAPKTLRGMTAEFENILAYSKIPGPVEMRVALLKVSPSEEFPEGFTLRVFAEDAKQWERWMERKHSGGSFTFTIKHRPREFLDVDGKVLYYGIASSGVVMTASKYNTQPKKIDPVVVVRKSEEASVSSPQDNLIPYFNGALVSKDRMAEILKGCVPAFSCTSCLNPISLDDAHELHWAHKQEPYCPDCMKGQLNNYSH